MSHTVQRVFSLCFCLFVLSACAHDDLRTEEDHKYSFQRIYPYPFESVWRATQLALKYPIAVNNMDQGVIETEWIRSMEGFQSPAIAEPRPGIRYKITANLVKGKADGRPTVRLTLVKKIEMQRDFFSEAEAVESDGLEEKALLYRIEREIIIDEAIKKATRS